MEEEFNDISQENEPSVTESVIDDVEASGQNNDGSAVLDTYQVDSEGSEGVSEELGEVESKLDELSGEISGLRDYVGTTRDVVPGEYQSALDHANELLSSLNLIGIVIAVALFMSLGMKFASVLTRWWKVD